MHGSHYSGHWGGGHHMLGWILCIAILVLAVVGLVTIIRALSKAKNPPVLPRPKSEAVKFLEMSYAEGKIDKDIFEERRSVLDPKQSS